jgi:hypothetical protein
MKRLVVIFPLLLILTGLPVPVLAWPLTLHDDGGPYQAMAVDSRGSLVVAAIVTPTTIELTAASAAGQRLGWSTINLPTELWQQPRRQVWLKLYRSYLDIVLVAGDDVLNEGRRYRVPMQQRLTSTTFSRPVVSVFAVPEGTRDLALWQGAGAAYAVWRTQDEDGIAAIHMTRLPG